VSQLLPGTEVIARGLRWEVVGSESLGPQTLYWLRGLEGVVLGHEFDLLHDLEQIQPVVHEISPDKAGPLPNWLVYHQAFLLEQSLGPSALLAVQPGRLRIEPYQLVPGPRNCAWRVSMNSSRSVWKRLRASMIPTGPSR
jgi:hypothetical protein